jgi:hypothetical protein
MTEGHDTSVVDYRQITWAIGYRFGDDGSAWSQWKQGRYPTLTDRWRRLAVNRKKQGYPIVRLIIDGKPVDFRLHRLILEAFRGPCPVGLEGLHWDDNPMNNQLSNLRWGTKQENIADSKRNRGFRKGVGEACHTAKLTEEDIPVIRRLRAEGWTYPALAARYGVTKANIRMIVLRVTWAHVA